MVVRPLIAAAALAAFLPTTASADPEYLAAIEPAARAVAEEFRIPASVAAAQSALESGWGKSEMAKVDHNYFGFKCNAAGHGPIAIGCRDHPTTECTPDCHPAVGSFRVYETKEASFRDYGRLITTSKYYEGALPLAEDPDAFITEVAKKYATDPGYAEKVIKLMREHDMYAFDQPKP
ncbi:glucosaminidase domain-containing protein [Actinokineospora pegani]|uniref:glucosaminidase domain-containing protein n=1 Tax=Actinokineospora pegani TaxID=2654637 RepID=UPI0012EAA06E|nr:glucosaminidase domain-containing protein [Actinokineospora pegani]